MKNTARTRNVSGSTVVPNAMPESLKESMKHIQELEEIEKRRQKAEELVKKISLKSANLKGKKFSDSIISQLASILKADYVFVGELVSNNKRIKTLSLCVDGKIAPNFSYKLENTPCEHAKGKIVCIFRKGVSVLFPKDKLLIKMGVEGYAGRLLFNSRYCPNGIIVALYRKPIRKNTELLNRAIFDYIAPHAAAEIERLKSEKQTRNKNRQISKSSQQYQTLFNRMIDGYSFHEIIQDESGKPINYRFLDINPAFERMTGLSRDIIGKTVREVMPDIEDSWIETYGNVALTGNSIKFDNYAGPLGKWFEIIAFCPSSKKFACVFIDITERKSAEEELHHLRNLFSNIINSMPSVLIGVNPKGQVIEWNKEAEKETGILQEAARGKMLADIFPQLEKEMDRIRSAISNRKTEKNEKISIKKNGLTRYNDLTIYPLIANGVDGAVIRIDDITERVHLEEMMIQSEKMMSVGGLAAGMAHEINNPLAGILQNIQVVINRTKTEMEKNRKLAETCGTTIEAISSYMEQRGILSMLDAISESGTRAAQIVENMLSFSRKSESKYAPHDVRQLLDQTLQLAGTDYDLKKKYDFRRIEIKKDYAQDAPNILCEATKIQQVFLNLLKNGAQAMSERIERGQKNGKSIEKPVFTLRIRYEKDIEMVRVEIEDNGTGMDETTTKRIFEPFFTTREAGVGTGLGLSISYFIITRNHNGRMHVESIPGQGTTFILQLPVEKRDET